MGHAAYMRGSAAISAHISQTSKERRRPDADALFLESARADREQGRADKAERELKRARRSVVNLRGTLAVEREERLAEREALRKEIEDWKYKVRFAAKAIARAKK